MSEIAFRTESPLSYLAFLALAIQLGLAAESARDADEGGALRRQR